MPTPSAASWRTMRKSRSHSAGERAEVGSSMIRMRASSDRALAISTSCCSPMRRPPTRASGSRSMPSRCEERPRRAGHGARGRGRGRRASGSRPRKMLAATESSGTRFSSWWMMAMPARSASRTRGEARPASPSIRISPSSAGCTPERIFISVDLPAPFSPISAWTLAGAEVEVDAVERRHAGEPLADAEGAQKIRVADVRRAGHASRTPPKVLAPSCGESTIDKLGRQARAGQGSAIGAGNPNPVWDSVAGGQADFPGG